MFEIVAIAFALAMDCFAVSTVCGMILRKRDVRIMLSLAFLFGVFQAGMPLIGWFLTTGFRGIIEAWDHWIAFGLLCFIGGKMILDAFRAPEDTDLRPQNPWARVVMAVATSIDALAVGISYACTGYDSAGSLLLPIIVIGAVSFGMSIAGFLIGVGSGNVIVKKIRPELIGGVILIAIGVRILLTHLLG